MVRMLLDGLGFFFGSLFSSGGGILAIILATRIREGLFATARTVVFKDVSAIVRQLFDIVVAGPVNDISGTLVAVYYFATKEVIRSMCMSLLNVLISKYTITRN